MKLRQVRVIHKFWIPAVGFASLIWFLIRVVPKPSRAFYPCQSAAFPLAASFIIWLVGLFSSLNLIRIAKSRINESKNFAVAFCLILGLGILVTINGFISNLDAKSKPSPAIVPVVMENSVPNEISNLKTTVSIVQSDKANAADIEASEIDSMVREAIQMAGGLEDLVSDNMTIVLKPNLVCTFNYANNQTVSQEANGMITDYRVIQAVVNVVRELNPHGKVYVMEGSALGTTTQNMVTMGWNKVTGIDDFIGIEEESGDWYEYTSSKLTYVELPDSIALYPDIKKPNGTRNIYLNKIYYEADVLISIPVLKNHSSTGVTGAVKNVGIGATPGKIYGNGPTNSNPTQRWNGIDHGNTNYLHKWIHDFYACRPVDFAVMDGLQGNDRGPVAVGYSSFTSAQKNTRLILAGKDAVSLDAIASLVMGHDPQKVNHLVHLHNSGLGNVNPALIYVNGKSVENIRQSFANYDAGQSAVFKKFAANDYNPDSIVYSENTVHVYMNDTTDLVRMQYAYGDESFSVYRLGAFNKITLSTLNSTANDSSVLILYTDKYLNTLSKIYKGTYVKPLTSITNPRGSADENLMVYPNPVLDQLNINISNNVIGHYEVSLLNQSGQTIKHFRIYKDGNAIEISLSIGDLKSGNYFLLLEHNSICITEKIVKI